MALELWIVLALVFVGVILTAIARLRRKRKAEPPASEGGAYPLW